MDQSISLQELNLRSPLKSLGQRCSTESQADPHQTEEDQSCEDIYCSIWSESQNVDLSESVAEQLKSITLSNIRRNWEDFYVPFSQLSNIEYMKDVHDCILYQLENPCNFVRTTSKMTVSECFIAFDTLMNFIFGLWNIGSESKAKCNQYSIDHIHTTLEERRKNYCNLGIRGLDRYHLSINIYNISEVVLSLQQELEFYREDERNFLSYDLEKPAWTDNNGREILDEQDIYFQTPIQQHGEMMKSVSAPQEDFALSKRKTSTDYVLKSKMKSKNYKQAIQKRRKSLEYGNAHRIVYPSRFDPNLQTK